MLEPKEAIIVWIYEKKWKKNTSCTSVWKQTKGNINSRVEPTELYFLLSPSQRAFGTQWGKYLCYGLFLKLLLSTSLIVTLSIYIRNTCTEFPVYVWTDLLWTGSESVHQPFYYKLILIISVNVLYHLFCASFRELHNSALQSIKISMDITKSQYFYTSGSYPVWNLWNP